MILFKSYEDNLQEINLNIFFKKAIWSHILFSLPNICDPMKYIRIRAMDSVMYLTVNSLYTYRKRKFLSVHAVWANILQRASLMDCTAFKR